MFHQRLYKDFNLNDSSKDNQDKIKEFTQQLRRNYELFELLGRIIDEEMEKLRVIDNNDFDSNSWAYKEAFRHGKYNSLKTLKDIVTLKEGKK